MCKLFLILLILTSILSLSFSTNNSDCAEEKYSYELQLNLKDPDVVKFAEVGWNKLVAEGKTSGQTRKNNFYYIICARVQVIDTERRYTIIISFPIYFPSSVDIFICIIIVMTNQTDPLSISCHPESLIVSIILSFLPDKLSS
ncbi:hypothetical protein KQX54_012233 [Cotesia glomerata]|uniref:Uncharacterized protein n=1 Tax=Cotesia glomerata TaxID=32391 RepID=A0AAV7ISD2_COTGL|nr:hypothetical protein KQX54_012233 [Cotesia glomerata]